MVDFIARWQEIQFHGHSGPGLLLQAPTMMLLMGMWMSLTKNPMKPMMAKPIAVAIAIFVNSFRSGFVHLFTNRAESLANCMHGSNCIMRTSMVVFVDSRSECLKYYVQWFN